MTTEMNTTGSKQKTAEDYIKAAEAKGLKWEAYSTLFDSKFDDDYTFFTNTTTWIGIELSPLVWFWFNQSIIGDFTSSIRFIERYSQRTGKSIKSWKKGWEAQQRLFNA